MKQRALSIGRLCVFVVLQLAVASLASAQATRTWVSGVGDDANPCSRTAPCKTFAGAISKTAAGGEISVLDPGGYGVVTITKAITINGEGTLASILASGTNGIVISAQPSDVVIIRNIDINGAGGGLNGIVFHSGAALHVERCKIFGFTGQGLLFQPTATSDLFVTGTTLRNNAGGAVYVQPQGVSAYANAALDQVVMEDNGRGLRGEDGAAIVVQNSVATGNAANGFVALASSRPVDLTINNSISSLNGAVGVYSGALATVRISNVTVTGNNVGLQSVSGGSIISFRNNSVLGNNADGAPTLSVGQI